MAGKSFNGRNIAIFLIFSITIVVGSIFIFSKKLNPLPEKEGNVDKELQPQKPIFQPPEIVKAVYLTSWSAATPRLVDYVIDIAKNTEINSVVIDIKDWSGYIAYDTQVPAAEEYKAERVLLENIEEFLERFHEEGIYVIARITVFQDPVLARARSDLAVHQKLNKSLLWLDDSGLAWIDPASKEAWDYNVAIASDALGRGFDELNFDYVRFPSDGDLQNISFPLWDGITQKHLIIKNFFKHLREKLPKGNLSIDLFGLSTVDFDLGVGQVIEDAYQYFDFVSPMVYPSHYDEGFLKHQNPAEYPYEVVKYSMENALKKLKLFKQANLTKVKLRPWLQDFDLGADYGREEVRSEINAVSEALREDFSGFMLWNSENIYTQEALLSANAEE